MRERAHREASSVLLVPLGYVVSDGGQACPLCHLGPPNPEGSLRLTGCVSVPHRPLGSLADCPTLS